MTCLAVKAIGRQGENQRIAGCEMPDFGGIDPMPGRNLACLQQEVNAGHGPAAAAIWRISKGFDIMSAFRVRLHPEVINQPSWRHGHGEVSAMF